MQIANCAVVVTGGASGLGRATAELLTRQGAHVVIADLPTSDGERVARQIGGQTQFVAADVTSEAQMIAVFDAAETLGTLRAVVHCAGRGGPLRVVDKQGFPGSLEQYQAIIHVNLVAALMSFDLVRRVLQRRRSSTGNGASSS